MKGRRALLEELWLNVTMANKGLPEHTRIGRDMILVASMEKPFLRAGKGTIIRRLTYDLFTAEIDLLYHKRGLNAD